MNHRVPLFLVSLVVVAVSGFTVGRISAPTREQSGRTLVSWEGGRITDEDFLNFASSFPQDVRAQLTSVEARKRLLDQLVEAELLAQEARARGLDRDPTVEGAIRRTLGARLLDVAVTEPSLRDIEDGELQAFLEAHRAEYEQPERIRLSVLYLNAPVASSERSEKEARARELARTLRKADTTDALAFVSAVRTVSEHAQSKRADGDLGPRTREELVTAFGPELAEAVWSAPPGTLTGVIPTSEGFFIAKVKSHLPARAAEVAPLRDILRSRIRSERRVEAHAALLREVRTRLAPQVDRPLLESLQIAK